MATKTAEVGALALPIGQYIVAIDAAISLVVPTTAQRSPIVQAGVTKKPLGGTMELLLSLEVQNARFTVDGTVPTTTSGILLVAPGFLNIRGENAIRAFKIIGVAAGGLINYGFTEDEPG